MANEDHVEILRQGTVVWNVWREENPDILPDLSGANLTDAKLNHAKLDWVNLSGASLARASLNLASLGRAELLGAQAQGANFGGANFDRANIIGATLIKTDLREAHFYCADLTGTVFERSNLSRAKLDNAILTRANLIDADLSDADLTGAFFNLVRLSNANLTGAKIGRTVFTNSDLSTVKGLESVYHQGPSTIDFECLYKSNGKIPDVFLRGIGLAENVITYLPSLIAQPIDFYSCFISYSHTDKSFARRLHDTLQGRGIRCWLDEHELLPGDKIYSEVDKGIRLWDKVLLLCSRDALKSWWVDNEIKIAFDKEQQLWHKRGKEVLSLIPINLDDYLFEWPSGMATEVRARMAADFVGWERDNSKFEQEFERLVRALRTDSKARRPPPASLL